MASGVIYVDRAKQVGCPWTWAVEHTQCVLEHLQRVALEAVADDRDAGSDAGDGRSPLNTGRAAAQPLDGDADAVLLIANDGVSGFEVPRKAAARHSTFLHGVLSELSGENEDGPDTRFGVISDALEAAQLASSLKTTATGDAAWKVTPEALQMVDAMPGVVSFVGCREATPAALYLFATWLGHHDERRPGGAMEVPTPSLVHLADVVDDQWDAAYLTTVVSPVDAVTEDLKDAPGTMAALSFAVFLGADAWAALLASFVVFQLRRALRLAASPGPVIARWLKCTEPLSQKDMQDAEAVAAAVMQADAPMRVRRPVDTAQWHGILAAIGVVNDLDSNVPTATPAA